MLDFYCFDPEVAQKMPIVPAKNIKFDWIDSAKSYYNLTDNKYKVTKCPGIFSLTSRGWVQRTYQDIVIETNGDGESFLSRTLDQRVKRGGEYSGEYVNLHPKQQLQIFKSWRQDTLKTVLKIQSPWCVVIPKGYSLLMMPIPYADDVRFTAATGLLKGKTYLNVQLYWHCLNSVEIIKAGTPLNQMVLIKDESVDFNIKVIEDINEFVKDLY